MDAEVRSLPILPQLPLVIGLSVEKPLLEFYILKLQLKWFF
jgi:hypothetical protein